MYTDDFLFHAQNVSLLLLAVQFYHALVPIVGILCKTNKPTFCLILKVSHALVVCLVYYLDCICFSLYINALPEWAIPKNVQTQTEGS